MLEYYPKDLTKALWAAGRDRQRKRSRLRVQFGEASYPVLRMWHDGLALDATTAPHLRGLVDVYDGANHIFHCLIIASTMDGDELICEFKHATRVRDRAALDYARDETAPVALLPKA
jgi:hypothetical protein